MTPVKIGRYQIKSELGRGGMSTVYLAYDPNVDREVAIKLLPREFLHHEEFRVRFNREARIIAALEHPAIVPIYDFGEEEGQPYFVMRHMSGGSLADRLKKGPLQVEDASKIIERIGSSLQFAHSKGIVHRDLKPGNILFDQFDTAYLGDFGIARLQETGATLTGSVFMGTPAYMSPEQVQAVHDLDGRADIYALGVILYEMLTGAKPYSAPTAAGTALKHITEPVPHILLANPNLPPDMEQVINKAMAKNPDERYPTATDLSADVITLASGKTIVGGKPPKVEIDATMIAGAAAVGAAAAGAGAVAGKAAAKEAAEAPKAKPKADKADIMATAVVTPADQAKAAEAVAPKKPAEPAGKEAKADIMATAVVTPAEGAGKPGAAAATGAAAGAAATTEAKPATVPPAAKGKTGAAAAKPAKGAVSRGPLVIIIGVIVVLCLAGAAAYVIFGADGGLGGVFGAGGATETPSRTPTTAATATQEDTPTATVTNTPTETGTPLSTNTPTVTSTSAAPPTLRPTNTPAPTNTPRPTFTPTRIPPTATNPPPPTSPPPTNPPPEPTSPPAEPTSPPPRPTAPPPEPTAPS